MKRTGKSEKKRPYNAQKKKSQGRDLNPSEADLQWGKIF